MSTDPSPLTVLSQWSFEPTVLLGLVLAAGLYANGVLELRRRNRYGKLLGTRHVVSFSLGLLCLILALASPIDTYGGDLFAAHMLQHVLLLSFAPPLLLLGKPVPVLLVGAPLPLVRALARARVRKRWFRYLVDAVSNPAVATTLYISLMCVWHLPALYQAALENQSVHLVEHMCYVFTGLMFWWVIIQPFPGTHRLGYAWRLLNLLAALAAATGLSTVFLLADQPLYPFYSRLPRLWGISPVEDQGWAGFMMMLLGDTVLLIAVAILVVRALDRLDSKELARAVALEERRGAVSVQQRPN